MVGWQPVTTHSALPPLPLPLSLGRRPATRLLTQMQVNYLSQLEEPSDSNQKAYERYEKENDGTPHTPNALNPPYEWPAAGRRDASRLVALQSKGMRH